MKRLITAFALAAALALPACVTAPAGSAPVTAADAAQQTRDGIAKAIQGVTLARTAMTQLAVAKKITWAQDDAAQAALTLIRANLDQAKLTSLTDPAHAAQLLADALTALAAYQGAKP